MLQNISHDQLVLFLGMLLLEPLDLDPQPALSVIAFCDGGAYEELFVLDRRPCQVLDGDVVFCLLRRYDCDLLQDGER